MAEKRRPVRQAGRLSLPPAGRLDFRGFRFLGQLRFQHIGGRLGALAPFAPAGLGQRRCGLAAGGSIGILRRQRYALARGGIGGRMFRYPFSGGFQRGCPNFESAPGRHIFVRYGLPPYIIHIALLLRRSPTAGHWAGVCRWAGTPLQLFQVAREPGRKAPGRGGRGGVAVQGMV